MSYQSAIHINSNKRNMYNGKEGPISLESTKPSNRDINHERDYKPEILMTNGINNAHINGPNTSESYVGFSNLPNQIYRKAVRRGFEFNLMVVGESGLGKSTFINSLFLSEVYNADYPGPSIRPRKTTTVNSNTVLLKENGVHLKLNLIDTPGFGDGLDNTNCWHPVLEFISARFDEYITCESRVNRPVHPFLDQRVHACIYFIAPTGHSLKQLDLEFLSRVQNKVNVIPVIAKSDTLTPDECREFKNTIMGELASHKIRVFEFHDLPEFSDRHNDDDLLKIRRLRDRIPFAVVGANTLVTNAAGARVRGRVYPWGTVEVENIEHNDFTALRYLLLSVYMQELRDITHNVHYENYRNAKLSGIAMESHFQTHEGRDPMALMETEKKEHEAKLRRMEAEMEAVFDQKVQEKNQKLRELEADLLHRIEQMREQLKAQEVEHEAARRAFELERHAWEENWREWDIGSDIGTNGATLGLGERVMNEVIKERSKTEKKKKGLF